MGVFRVDETTQKDEEKETRVGDFFKIETKIGSLESPRTFIFDETFI